MNAVVVLVTLLPQQQPSVPGAPSFWVPSVARCRQSIARRNRRTETGASFPRPHGRSEHTRVVVAAPRSAAVPSLHGEGSQPAVFIEARPLILCSGSLSDLRGMIQQGYDSACLS